MELFTLELMSLGSHENFLPGYQRHHLSLLNHNESVEKPGSLSSHIPESS